MALPACFPKFYVLLLATLVLSFCIPSFSQSENATLSGTITDPSGATVPGAQVKLMNVNTGSTATVPSNESGLYVFAAVHPGQYRMVVEKTGFRQIVLTDLTVNVQDGLSRNFKLQLGVVGESVTVSGDLAKVNTQDASVSTVVDSQFVENMPLNGRSFQSLIYATPGVFITTSDDWGQSQFSTNGQRTDANYFTIDGVSANFGGTSGAMAPGVGQTLGGTTPAMTSGGGTNSLVSVDAMQEFRIQTSSYAPEFGRQPGAQISIVTKGGSNKWHGTASEYLRNDVFDARGYFDNAGPGLDLYGNPIPPSPKPPLRQNDFGGTVGGPIWKDRTFFFFSYEGLRLSQPNLIQGYFFTAGAKAAVAAANSAWVPIVNATPTGTGGLYDPTCDNITNPCLGLLDVGYSNPSGFNVYSLRLDHKITNKINLFARYSDTPSHSDTLADLTGNEISFANTQTATLGVTATITPSLLNDFRGNWSRQVSGSTYAFAANYGAVAPPASVVPPAFASGFTAYLTAITGAGNVAFALGSTGMDNTHQLNFVDTVSKTVGTHQLKFGVDFRRPSTFEHPTSSFIGIPTAWSQFLNGNMLEALNQSSVPLSLHMNNWSFFGQDTWRATHRLTLTYGLRWDIDTPPVSDTAGKPLYTLDGVFNSNPLALVAKPLFNTYHKALAPRLGVAYQLNPKTTLRSGFGLFYDLPYGGGLSYALAAPPYSASQFFFGYVNVNDFTNPAYQQLPQTTDLSQLAYQTLTAVNPNLKPPVTYQWNVAVERELGKAQTLTVTYLGASGHNLLYNSYLPPYQAPFVGVYLNLNSGSSRYNALQAQFMRRMSHGLQAMVSYSYSHSNDTISNDYTADRYFTSVSAIQPPPLTPSDFDFHQTFRAIVSYEVPKPAWGGKAGTAVLGGWALDGLLQKQSDPPLTVTIGETDPVLGNISVIASEVPGQPIWIPASREPAGKALNPAAFTIAADGSSAFGLRNSIRSPYGILQTDMALRRRFNITERVKLDFRAEYFNLFNHPMFGGGSAPDPFLGTCYSNTAATCTAASGNWYPNPAFGKVFYSGSGGGQTLNVGLGSQSPLYAPGGHRSGQFTLKLTF